VLAHLLRLKPAIRCVGRRIDITSQDGLVPTHLDGDLGPNLPVQIGIVSAGAKVLVPRKRHSTLPEGRFAAEQNVSSVGPACRSC